MVKASGVGRRRSGRGAAGHEAAQVGQSGDGGQPGQFGGGFERRQSGQEFEAGAHGAAQGGKVAEGVREADAPVLEQVDAGLHALVPDPVGVAPAGLFVRHRDGRQVDEAAGLVEGEGVAGDGGHGLAVAGAAEADELHDLGVSGHVVGLPRRPVIGGVVRLARQGGALRSCRPVASAAHKPGGRLVGPVAAPDSGPHRIAQGGCGHAGLGEVGPGGRPAVRTRFLLQLAHREPERGHRIEPRPRAQLMLHHQSGLDRDEGGDGDDGED